jgi:hypothetical protein
MFQFHVKPFTTFLVLIVAKKGNESSKKLGVNIFTINFKWVTNILFLSLFLIKLRFEKH